MQKSSIGPDFDDVLERMREEVQVMKMLTGCEPDGIKLGTSAWLRFGEQYRAKVGKTVATPGEYLGLAVCVDLSLEEWEVHVE